MERFDPQRHLYEYHRDSMAEAACWHASNDACPAHFHSSLEIVYVRRGCLEAQLDGQPLQAPAEHLLLVSGYTVHAYQSPCPNEDTLLIIPTGFVPSMQKLLMNSAFSAPLCDLRRAPLLRSVADMIAEGWEQCGTEARRGLCNTLLGLLAEQVGLTPISADAPRGLLREALIYLQNNYQQSLPMAELARRFGYSKSRFSHLFNERLGCSPGAFVSALRCQHAARKMLTGTQPLLEIALEAGFECPRTFYRAFKQYYGLTPTQYIRTHGAG